MTAYKLTEKAAADFARLYEYGLDTFGLVSAFKLTPAFERLAENPFVS